MLTKAGISVLPESLGGCLECALRPMETSLSFRGNPGSAP
jgi:hypothetical protein